MTPEQERLNELRSFQVLDTPSDRFLDNLTSLAATICGAPIALISLVDENRQWFLSRIGLETTETPREISFCHHAIQQDLLFIVEDTKSDPYFQNNELVNGDLGIGFYAGMPLKTSRGYNIGTLCVIDRKPNTLDAFQRKSLMVLGHAVIDYLTLRLTKRNAERQKEEFNRFFTMGLDLICTATADGYFKMLNPVWKTELGYELDELRQQPFLNLVHPDDREATIATMQKLAQSDSKVVLFKNRYRHKDGHYVWLSWNAMTDTENNLIYATARNITEMIQLEEQVKQDMLLSKKKDEEKILQLSKLTSSLSHEIQNPLNMIVGFSEVAIETVEEITNSLIEKESRTSLKLLKTDLEKVHAHAKHISDLVKIMSEISVPGIDGYETPLPADTHALNVNRVLLESEKVALDSMRKRFPEFDCEIRNELDPMNPKAKLSVGVLSRALVNIFVNAFESLQFRRKLNPAFKPKLSIKTESGNNGVDILVTNNGPAIRNADRHKIFNPFFSTKSSGSNKGLGLTVSYCLLKKYRGDVLLESSDDRNTTFRVHLPVS